MVKIILCPSTTVFQDIAWDMKPWKFGNMALHMQVCCSEYFLSALLDIGSNIHHYNYLLVCIASVYTL